MEVGPNGLGICMNTIIWIILTVFFIVLEAVTVSMVSVWFAIGAAVAAAAAYMGANLPVQAAIFAAVSAAALIIFKKVFGAGFKTRHIPTNADRLIGRAATVLEEIDPIKGTGTVDVQGQVWSAQADEKVEKGAVVEILAISGVKLTVKERAEVK